jgi:hypothetical protein
VSGQVTATAGSLSATVNVFVNPKPVLYIEPRAATLDAGATQVFAAFSGPPDASGNPDLGPDGLPGTPDDEFEALPVSWSTSGGIGTVSPDAGSETTTLTTAAVPAGETASGTVTATDARGTQASVAVTVVGPAPAPADALAFVDSNEQPTDTVSLFEPDPGVANAIRTNQEAYNKSNDQTGRDAAIARITALVTDDARYNLTAPVFTPIDAT